MSIIIVVVVSLVAYFASSFFAKMIDTLGTVRKQTSVAGELELRARNAVKIAERFGETESFGNEKAIVFNIENGSASDLGNGNSVSVGIQISQR